MNNVEEIIKAFHKARIEGEKKLFRGEISWEDYGFVMLGFEHELRGLGVHL
jgi:hypothetical protein